MIRLPSIRSVAFVAGAFGAFSFAACGGNADGLFSPNDGSSSAGIASSSAGSSAAGGHSFPVAGSSSLAGSSSSAGSGAVSGGMGSGGNTSTTNGGANNAGTSSSGNAGGEIGGSSTGGSSTGGSSTAGSSAGGSSAGGAAGTSSAGSANGGSESGGSAGTNSGGDGNGGAGISGASGAGGAPTCQDLFAQADSELDAARACDTTRNAEQCTGKVNDSCGCQVPVESNNSAETEAYLATLKQIQQRRCSVLCSAIACLPVQHASCVSSLQGQSSGMCVTLNAVPATK
ncbi:MAG TPA: hypothetical protein VHV51_16525 [Polyangiaceae bacterium]|nr:hypothetical protein [Polyangiaceae bacterium]